MRRLTFTTLLVSSALVAGMGYNMPAFSDLDTNSDGKVTQEEFESTQQARMTAKAESGRLMRNAGNASNFSEIDANSDGAVDQAEFSTHQQAQMKNNPNPKGGMGQVK